MGAVVVIWSAATLGLAAATFHGEGLHSPLIVGAVGVLVATVAYADVTGGARLEIPPPGVAEPHQSRVAATPWSQLDWPLGDPDPR